MVVVEAYDGAERLVPGAGRDAPFCGKVAEVGLDGIGAEFAGGL